MMPARYLRLLSIQLRTSASVAMQYRSDFLIEGFMSLMWLGWSLIPVAILYSERHTIAGWDLPSALVVMGWFTILRGVLEGAINPSLIDVVERIRTGSFDYLLLKPVDAQFLVSTSRFSPWKLVDVFGGLGLMIYAFTKLGRTPAIEDAALATGLLIAGATVLYSIWILVVSASFWVVRIDNLTYLFSSIFDAARWPVHIFKGFWRVLFTAIIPLAVMTTYPAMALLNTLESRTAILAAGGSVLFAGIARFIWIRAMANYTSASS